MGVTAAVTAASSIGSAVIGNQKKQKAKGEAAAAQRASDAAQAAADAKLKAAHSANIQAQSQAAQIARNSVAGTAPQTLLTPPTTPVAPTIPTVPLAGGPAAGPRKVLLGS